MLISRPRPDVFLRFQNGDFFLRLAYRLHQERQKSLSITYLLQKIENVRQSGFLKGQLLVYQPVPGSQIVGKRRKWKAREKGARREKGNFFPPVLFSCWRFLNSADLTISEPGDRLLVHVGTDENGCCRIRWYHISYTASVTHGLWGILSYFHHIFMSVFEWTGENDSKRYCRRVFFENGGKNLRFQKIAEACGRDPISNRPVRVPFKTRLSMAFRWGKNQTNGKNMLKT